MSFGQSGLDQYVYGDVGCKDFQPTFGYKGIIETQSIGHGASHLLYFVTLH